MKRKMKPVRRIYRMIAWAVLITLSPIAIMIGAALSLPNPYAQTYLSGLALKYERLCQTDSPKYVIIGGSSAAFGLNSEWMALELGRPCVNFGLYAALGSQMMIDLSRRHIGAGDTVILMLECNEQMWSDYFDPATALQALAAAPGMLLDMDPAHWVTVLTSLPEYVADSYAYWRGNNAPNPDGVYRSDVFNAWGDIIYPRSANIMMDRYLDDDSVTFSESWPSDAYLRYLNDYTAEMRARGAEVVISFCPINRMCLNADDVSAMEAFQDRLAEALDAEVISNIAERVLDEGYFYDSNYHMNDPGVTQNTALLLYDLKRRMNDMSPVAFEVAPPFRWTADESLMRIEEGAFLYEVGTQGVAVVGLSASGQTAEQLTVPSEVEHLPVTQIATRAFAGALAREIDLPDTITALGSALFEGCASLTTVYVRSRSLPATGATLLSGAPESLTLCVPSEQLNRYLSDYFWLQYAARLAAF